ncbi:AbrB/MazE/SpoVT family DNA-binding domain-containing protein [Viridibacillus arvi]|uniref:AbrB/MazE/SpoVT family DNA-binding domain-containing protein n=1 Tax=Viridibacillus arvi TaxID=263475 RepID=UPI0034CEF21F
MKIEEKSTVTSKGQVTIPKKIRTFLKINERDKLKFSIDPTTRRVYLTNDNQVNICPLCEGEKLVDLNQPCFICCEEGRIDLEVNPYSFFRVWFEKYLVSITYIQTNAKGNLQPNVEVIAPNYFEETIRKSEVILLIWLLNQSPFEKKYITNIEGINELKEKIPNFKQLLEKMNIEGELNEL